METRWLTIGAIFDAIFSVVYTIRNHLPRIISARYTSRKRRKEYDKHNNQEGGKSTINQAKAIGAQRKEAPFAL
ncbi:MAG: BrnT family toxin [Saprospirales bacterium]|nr:BrnT family toxin [Saprospirales bacterium]